MSEAPVLCAFDASEPSLLAARVAVWIAGALRAPLELVYVVDHDALPALPRHGDVIVPQEREALYEIQEQIAEDAARADLEAALAALPHADVMGSVLTGSPADVIRRRAADRGATLLVSGTAARRGLEHLLHGSVSGALAAGAPCPVVTVPPGAAPPEPGPGTRGRGPLHGRLLGSVSTGLVRTAGRPVVLVSEHAGEP